MKTILLTACILLLLAVSSCFAPVRKHDRLEAAGFTEEMLSQSFEGGCALVVVRVSSVREEKSRNNIIFYYNRMNVLRSIIDGDLITKNLSDPLEIFGSLPNGEALTPGSVYALLIIQRAPQYWVLRDAVIMVDSAQSPLVNNLNKFASRVYETTSIFEFRKHTTVVNKSLPALPELLLSHCEKFRRNPDGRVRFAKAIAESDLGSRPDQSQPMSWRRQSKKPKVILSRSQALSLLGEPTYKSGRHYLWHCGRDSSIDQPGEWVGVLSVSFDNDANVRTLGYGSREQWKSRKD